jgi:DNA-binding GntR family transcriptional regulator
MGEVPLYERVRQSIAQTLTDGTLSPGDKLTYSLVPLKNSNTN